MSGPNGVMAEACISTVWNAYLVSLLCSVYHSQHNNQSLVVTAERRRPTCCCRFLDIEQNRNKLIQISSNSAERRSSSYRPHPLYQASAECLGPAPQRHSAHCRPIISGAARDVEAVVIAPLQLDACAQPLLAGNALWSTGARMRCRPPYSA